MTRVKAYLLLLSCLLIHTISHAQPLFETRLPSQEGEKWWGGFVGYGHQMPYESSTRIFDLSHENFNNQLIPLFVSNQGRYVWCDKPFKFQFSNDTLVLYSSYEKDIQAIQAGETLRDAYLAASKKHFPPTGKIPEEVFFSKPQYNTWIELMYDQNQADIMKYAHDALENNFPSGIFMIDDNWQKYYGNFEFKPETFPNPKAMTDSLHAMGFDVMLWVCPYVSPDSREYRELAKKGFLVKTKNGGVAIIPWWNGYSACYDMTHPGAVAHLKKELVNLQTTYGIDGYKFDGGDVAYMRSDYIYYDQEATANDFSEAWAAFGKEFPFNELRTSWKLGGTELVQRLGDKGYSWRAASSLIPQMTTAGVLGHAYTCPDMIGGGSFAAFLNIDSDKFDQELIVRSAQIHALMPMMQFSVAPWRVLSHENLQIVSDVAHLHQQFADYILAYAKIASTTGEPIVRNMEYSFPNQGFALCQDQFMLGDKYLVAPMVTPGTERKVTLPKGVWKDDLGKKHKGGRTIDIQVPLSRLPYFEKVK